MRGESTITRLINKFINNKYPFIIVTVFSITILSLVYFISVPSLRIIEENISRRIELNRVYQQWLITEYSANNYLTSNKNKILKRKIGENLKLFETGLYSFINNISFQNLKNKYPEISKDSLRIINEWQFIRNSLQEIIDTENSYKNYEKQIYWLANNTANFDNKLKNIINWFENYNKKQFVFYWNMFYSLSVLLIFISVFFAIYIRKFLKARISEKKAKELLDSVVKVREKERHNIALEIHDTIIQDMVFSKMLCMEILNSRDKSSKKDELSELTDRLIKSIQQIRDISANLRPPEFEKDITVIITDYIKNFTAKTGITVDFVVNGIEKIRFDNPLKLNIYRIVQEALTNIKKHSKATDVRIRMLASYPFIILKIEDNGTGFEKDSALEKSDGKNNAGLRGIFERVKMVDGEIKIKSDPGEGVSLNIRIPLRENYYV